MMKINSCSMKLLSLAMAIWASQIRNQSYAQPSLIFDPVITSGLNSPVDFVNAGDGSNRVFVVQQGGVIRVYNEQFNFLSNFLTVTGITSGGERGLLSMAFPPNYSTTGFFYVYYTNGAGNIEIARYHVSADPNVADPTTKTVVLTIPHPTNANHNGGKLNFGTDGYLYFATGDGGSGGDPPNNAQNGNVLLGKMLRIAVNTSATPPFYTIPPDNPFVSDPNVSDEIYALGLRNPFRWSFDRQTQDMWIGDVGQNSWEEINFRASGATAGVNYGWRCYEGKANFNTGGCAAASNYVFPVHVYPNPGAGSSAVTGGVVYRGLQYPALQGYYFASDVYSGTVYLIKSNGSGGWNIFSQNGLPGTLACFGESEDGEVYAVSLNGGVYQVTTSAVLPPTDLSSFIATSTSTGVQLTWETSTEVNVQQFEIEYSTDRTTFQQVGIVPAENLQEGAAYDFHHTITFIATIYYRLKVVSLNGEYFYSDIISPATRDLNGIYIYPSVITDGIMKIYLNTPFNSLEMVSANGSLVLKQNINGRTGRIDIPVQRFLSGIYIVRLRNGQASSLQKILVRH